MNNMKDYIKFILGILGLVLFIGLCIWWSVAQYKECKRMNFSTFYCVQHAG